MAILKVEGRPGHAVGSTESNEMYILGQRKSIQEPAINPDLLKFFPISIFTQLYTSDPSPGQSYTTKCSDDKAEDIRVRFTVYNACIMALECSKEPTEQGGVP